MQVVKSHDYMNFVLDWAKQESTCQSWPKQLDLSLSLALPPTPPRNSPPPPWAIHNDTFSAYMSLILSFNETGLKNELWLKIK